MAAHHPADAVRAFNRFYTRRIGVLGEGLHATTWSLVQARVLYELAHRSGLTAQALCAELDLDPGYVSRILRGFTRDGLVTRVPAADDARRRPIALTAEGKRAFAALDRNARKEAQAMLDTLAPSDASRLVGAMDAIRGLLSPQAGASPVVLRTHRPGDMGWVVQAHGELYWQEFGWDERFEALVAHIAAEFVERLVPSHERCWIAERDGERVGSVFLVRKSATVAKLRLLIVHPRARGAGVGSLLVTECVRFARECGYRRLTLWTQRNLAAARRIYKAQGFALVATEEHAQFGVPLVGETWELDLVREA